MARGESRIRECCLLSSLLILGSLGHLSMLATKEKEPNKRNI